MIILLQINNYTPWIVLIAIIGALIPAIAIARLILGHILRSSNIIGEEKSDKKVYMHGDIQFYNHVAESRTKVGLDGIHNPVMKSAMGTNSDYSSASQLKHKRPNNRPAVKNASSSEKKPFVPTPNVLSKDRKEDSGSKSK